MRDAIAIVQPAIDVQQIGREITKAHIALQDCDRQLESAEKKTDGLRQEQARRRVEVGRLLIEAKRGIKHGGWLTYLEKLGIEQRSARDWMALAGYVETKSEPNKNGSYSDRTPTRREVNEARRRDEQPDRQPDESECVDIESEFVPVFKRVEKTIVKEAMQMFPKDRQLFAAWIRNVADEIDPTKQGGN